MTESKPSKTARKRENLALQTLGERLIDLTEDQLRVMGLPQNLFDAVTEAARIKSRGALRRQRQLIGKLMRNVDPGPIRRALDDFQFEEKKAKDIFRQAESWRDRLVSHGQARLKEFFEMTGTENAELSSLLSEFAVTSTDAGRRALRRRIFRLVHAELSGTQDTIEQ